MAVFMASGNVGGGVCDNCQHHTTGRSCELCKPYYYQSHGRDSRDPDICISCDCDPEGSESAGVCDGLTDPLLGLEAGRCHCKANVEGERCDRCKSGYFGLDANDPAGCQPCHCNPLGTVGSGDVCDQTTGDCFCKRFVTGQKCDQCLPEHWALGSDSIGCRPCECDVGGSLDNHCSPETGNCRCRENMVGRQCTRTNSNHFCMALDYYTYEAEEASSDSSFEMVSREMPAGRPVTWTGTGFVRVPEGGQLKFVINNVPKSMDYEILIRYEPQFPEVWEEAVVRVSRPRGIPTHSPCGNTIPADDVLTVSLPPGSRYVVLPQTVCLEHGVTYTMQVEFKRYSSRESVDSPHILVDSLVILPVHTSMTMFSESEHEGKLRRDAFERYLCRESGRGAIRQPLTDVCAQLICSLSAVLHNGALSCDCDPQGSLSGECDPNGGQCQCRPNVVGRRCDFCAPGTFGFGPSGCRSCDCNLEGSQHSFCNKDSGQCMCRPGVTGRHCDQCEFGHWGYPSCRPCHCNGHADTCEQRTGTCQDCRGHTAGHACERCTDGYFGNPILGSGEKCRPCPCPEGPGSGRNFALSCFQDPHSQHIVCSCQVGYTGHRCEECAPGHYGNPDQYGGVCAPCQCYGNIELSDPDSCDRQTGVCLRCLHHTHGPSCSSCVPGFYGNATAQQCRRCECDHAGSECHPNDGCECDAMSGQCLCLPHVTGKRCDRCVETYWREEGIQGCAPCACDPEKSFGASCNEMSGHCECRAGFGGRTCTECRELYYGDPNIMCTACDCDPHGAKTQQCDRRSGHCVCRAGVAGVRCDQCARGFSGTFPHCSPCHTCFGDWDRIVQGLGDELQGLAGRIQHLMESGAEEAFETDFRMLEHKLGMVQKIVDARNATTHTITELMNVMEELRKAIDDLTNRLTPLELELTKSQDQHSNLSAHVSELEQDVRRLNRSLNNAENELDFIKNSNYRGAYDTVREQHLQFQVAKERVNNSTEYATGGVKMSQALRLQAEDLAKRSQGEFERKNAELQNDLQELSNDVTLLDISRVGKKVCGGDELEPCETSHCGGPGCKDASGSPHCGGPLCGGTVTTATDALKNARDSEEEVKKAMALVQQLSREVEVAKSKSEKVKQQAKEVLGRANATRDRAQRSGHDLRQLISQIKDFLEQEGASPDSIEMVANEVLGLSVPASPEEISILTEEIKARVGSLANVDAILAQTTEDVQQARDLLIEAQHAKEYAEQVESVSKGAQTALEQAEVAQQAAQDAIQQAQEDIEHVQSTLELITENVTVPTAQLDKTEVQLNRFSQEMDELKVLHRSTVRRVEQAMDTSSAAKDVADEAAQLLAEKVHSKFEHLRQEADVKVIGVASVRTRANILQQQAQSLLKGAKDKLERLSDLEEQYEHNERNLAEKAHALDGLEEKLNGILRDINQQITMYNTCQ
uniref:laminin subunit beta-2-like n=1 Tax=Myxine glutinosa TaxID=7769 RepID=UPI00358E1F67